MNVVVAADPFAVTLKDSIKSFLSQEGYHVEDVGTSGDRQVDYFEAASRACEIMQKGKAERGILFCGSGAGMAIVAGKHKGIVAVSVESVFAAKMCRAINDANVLCLGAMIWGEWMAREAVKAFLGTEHTEGLADLKDFLVRSVREVRAIDEKTRA
jgi:ribose 5-phosphate isomerase B